MLRIVRIFLIVLLTPIISYSEITYKLQGLVTDKDTKEPLPGATIMIKGTYHGAYTDPEGKFKILGIKEGVNTPVSWC